MKQRLNATSGAAAVLALTLVAGSACAGGSRAPSGPTVQPPSASQPPYSGPAPGTQQTPPPQQQTAPPARTSPPATDAVGQMKLPALQQFALSNGMRVLVMEKHDIPLAQVNFIINAGSVNDPATRVGLARTTADMLDEGAAGRNALDLSSAFEMLGARFGVGASTHSASASLHVPVARLPDALRLAADVLLKPDFPEKELNRLRTEGLTSLLRARDQPSAVASALYTRTLFGEQHPYGRSVNAAALRALTITDVRRFYQTYYRPNNTTAIVVGDITASRARELLESAFGAWQRGDSPTLMVENVAQVTGRRIYIVDKPGAAQSVMNLARIGVPRSTADYYALEVMNTILGGSFTSRLNQNLREKNGYAYGAGSFFDYRLAAGPFIASSNVQTQSTGPALAEFLTELRRIREDVTQDEVNRAKNNLAMGYPAGFQSVAGIAGRLGELVTYDLPANYFNDYTGKVLGVTEADVERVAKQYVDPDNITIFIVGDRSKIEAQVKQLNVGPITFLTVEDVLGPAPVVR